MFKNWIVPCHQPGQAIRVIDNKIMIICSCLTGEDIQKVIDFEKIKKESNV